MNKPDFYRTVYVLHPEANVLYGTLENTITELEKKTSFSGISVTSQRDGNDLIFYSRPAFLEYATKDRAFIWHELNRYGVVKLQFQGRVKVGREMKWQKVEI